MNMNKYKENNETETTKFQITLTMSSEYTAGKTTIKFAGIGTISIDWGDGAQCEMHTISDDCPEITHNYSEIINESIITISGENITELDCCSKYQFTEIDVSKNPRLTKLNCSSNMLKKLNTSDNTALKWLD